jgi:uncharacterized membrane protein YwzB
MLAAVVYMILVLVVVAVVYWAVDKLAVPQPLNNIVKVGVVAVAIILVVMLFLQMLGLAPAGFNIRS